MMGSHLGSQFWLLYVGFLVCRYSMLGGYSKYVRFWVPSIGYSMLSSQYVGTLCWVGTLC